MAIEDLFAGILSKKPEERQLQYSFDLGAEEYREREDKDEAVAKLLGDLGEAGKSLRITGGLKADISKNVTSQIIHYKDAFKIANPALSVPFLLYGKVNGKDFAVILQPQRANGYLYAKALYYCLTEKEGVFDEAMNNIVALFLDNEHYEEVLRAVKDVLEGHKSFGAIQRSFDHIYIKDMDSLKQVSIDASKAVFESAKELIAQGGDRGKIIAAAVTDCYLLKKSMYVHFMKAKNLLDSRFGGDIKKQRQQAKEYADAIPFVSYSELWRGGEGGSAPARHEPEVRKAPAPLMEEDEEDVYVPVKDEDRAPTPEEVARKALGLDEEEPREAACGLMGEAADKLDELKEKAAPVLDKAQEELEKLGALAKDKADELEKKAGPLMEAAEAKTKDLSEELGKKADEAADKLAELRDQAEPYLDKAGQAAAGLGETIAKKADEVIDKIDDLNK